LYTSVNYIDLARDRLQAMLSHAPQDPKIVSDLTQQLGAINHQVKEVQDAMTELTLERQVTPLERAALARGRGAPGLALIELEEAERTGVNPAFVRPQLIDLYCDTGQPEKALDLLNSGNLEDTQATEPGASAARQARVNFLLGYYEGAARLWEDMAITRLRHDRALRALVGGSALLQGQPKFATSRWLEIPGKIGIQASWEFDLGMCLLEWGHPDLAAAPLTRALTLAPDFPLRPVAAYYLEKLGKPVPPGSTPKPEK
jgi:tetratricopeptide (TPR) repeat protein